MSPTDLDRRQLLKLAVIAAPAFALGAWVHKGTRQAVWSADGNLRFYSAPAGIHWTNAAGTRGGRFLPLGLSFALTAGSISPTADLLAYTALDRSTGSTIWTVPFLLRDGQPVAGKPTEFFRSGTFDVNPRFSPDGRRILYASSEAGTWNTYARSFPDTGHAERMPRFNL